LGWPKEQADTDNRHRDKGLLMFTNIVWATDGSEHAERALAYAGRLAESDHAHLHVVHVVEKIVGGRVAGQDAYINEPEIDHKIAEDTKRIASTYGVEATLHMGSTGMGSVAAHVAEIAKGVDADLIVIGTRGHSSLGGLVLGSVAQRLMHLATCPVLAVPPTARGASEAPADDGRAMSTATSTEPAT
jgi:nucleotide-binding universal stress UspA family protein